jgi:putative ABC transport system ATP-binding protein
MYILNAKNLTKIYGSENREESTRALNGISFRVENGEFVGIMGPSGSGKTTLLNILSGIDRPTSGQVDINNRDIFKMRKRELALFRRKEIGYVFQDFNLLDTLTLQEIWIQSPQMG